MALISLSHRPYFVGKSAFKVTEKSVKFFSRSAKSREIIYLVREIRNSCLKSEKGRGILYRIFLIG